LLVSISGCFIVDYEVAGENVAKRTQL